jgi:hypothetical protein
MLSSDQAAPATLPSSGELKWTSVSRERDNFFDVVFFIGCSLSCKRPFQARGSRKRSVKKSTGSNCGADEAETSPTGRRILKAL